MILLSGSAAFAEDLPVPPLPPDNLPLDQNAPVPNRDVQAPFVATPEHVKVNVKFYHADIGDSSLGFAPGSRIQLPEDRRPIQPPGFIVSVPMQ
jgi:hypothetical protein